MNKSEQIKQNFFKQLFSSNETSDEIVYKSCHPYIVVMKKTPDTITNENRTSITNRLNATYRANMLYVIDIFHKVTSEKINEIQNTSYKNKKLVYKVGSTVQSNFNTNVEDTYGEGIYYFLNKEIAYDYENNIMNGIKKYYYP